jgi:putative FmdB family regulatory protein
MLNKDMASQWSFAMPTYDYDCDSCGRTFELFQSISEPPAETCPNCGGAVKRRIHGGAGLIFKGSGFYLTDYKKAAPASAEGKAETGGEKTKSENAKPASDKPSDKNSNDAAKKPTTSSD